MPELLDTLRHSLEPDTIASISQQLGASETNTQQGIATLLPMLIGGLSQNASRSPQAANSLAGALEQDHDGSLLNSLAGGGGLGALSALLGAGGSEPGQADLGRTGDAQGILRHILGGKQEAVKRGTEQASGLSGSQTQQLMGLLGPVVMGALGKVKQEQKLDAQGITQLLDRERSHIEEEAPGTEQGGLLSLLDSNNDGKVGLADDVAKVGLALGAAFLMGRRRK